MTTGEITVIRCYRCSNPPTGQCAQCRRPFCRDHGNRLCLDCRRGGGNVELRVPIRGVPSSLLYRAAMVGVVIVVLLIALDSWQWISSGGPTAARAGQVARPTATVTAVANLAPAATVTPTGPREHTVAEGDTLSSIANQYNVTVEQIATFNNLGDRDTIRVGQVLKIPPK